MSGFLGVPVDAAYHLVSPFVSFLTPLLGGLAAAVAIVGFTVVVRLLLLPLSYRAMRGMAAQTRMAPLVQGLRKRHAGQPDRLQRELTALYRAEGTSMFAGCLPLLAQWPAFGVLSLLFRSQQVGGAPNTLLTHHLRLPCNLATRQSRPTRRAKLTTCALVPGTPASYDRRSVKRATTS